MSTASKKNNPSVLIWSLLLMVCFAPVWAADDTPTLEELGDDWHIEFKGASIPLGPGQFQAEQVTMRYGDAVLKADRITYDQDSTWVKAEGNVEFQWPGLSAKADYAEYTFSEKTGFLTAVEGEGTDEPFFFRVNRLEKVGPDKFLLEKGFFTTCDQEVPNWSMALEKARLTVDGYLTITHLRLKAKNFPLFYSPFMVWPVKSGRATGLLIPTFGNSAKRGVLVSNAFYLAPKDTWDATTYLDYYSKEGFGVGQEVRYNPTKRTKGIFQGYWIKQRSDRRNRWRLSYQHDQDLGNRWKLQIRLLRLSDIEFPRDYRRDFNLGSLSQVVSNILLTKSGTWGSFNARLEQQEQFFTTTESVTQSYLPEVEVRLRQRPFANSNVYWGFNGSASLLDREVSRLDGMGGFEIFSDRYPRLDINPFVEWPLMHTGALDITMRLSGRATWYGDSADPTDNAILTNDSLTRLIGEARLFIRGPRFFKVFHREGRKYKHIIEPELEYRFVSNPDDALKVPILDEIDRLFLDQNILRYALTSRLFKKNQDGKGQREIFYARLSQDYSFNRNLASTAITGEDSHFSPLTALLRYWATNTFSAEMRLRYNHLAKDVDSQSLSLHYVNGEDGRLSVSYLKAKNFGVSQVDGVGPVLSSEQLRLAGGILLHNGKITVSAALDWDILRDVVQNQRLILGWNTSCCSIGLEYSDRDVGGLDDSQIRFLFSLKGSTPFLDIPGQTTF